MLNLAKSPSLSLLVLIMGEFCISHQKMINSLLAKALMSRCILCKISNLFTASLLRDYLIYCTQIFKDSSLCYTLLMFSSDFLADTQ